jgi:hypothetical protein
MTRGAAAPPASLEPTRHKHPVAEIAKFFRDVLEVLGNARLALGAIIR